MEMPTRSRPVDEHPSALGGLIRGRGRVRPRAFAEEAMVRDVQVAIPRPFHFAAFSWAALRHPPFARGAALVEIRYNFGSIFDF